MDLLRAWVTAMVVFVLASMVTTVAAVGSDAAVDGLNDTTADRIAWNAVPMLLTFAAMTALGGAAHPRPQRFDTRRHAVATLAVPAALIPLALVYGLFNGPALSAWSGFVGALAGTASGWGLLRVARRLRSPG
ncbi:hypothetical protein [Actinomadura miaoliensis]|uniref:Ammonium transporter n=1 Tax=Actinomadura miaoliensis TaxID=430685 RepID=A0ABP7VFB6_9ACTN